MALKKKMLFIFLNVLLIPFSIFSFHVFHWSKHWLLGFLIALTHSLPSSPQNGFSSGHFSLLEVSKSHREANKEDVKEQDFVYQPNTALRKAGALS